MAYIKHTAIHTTPRKHLKYILKLYESYYSEKSELSELQATMKNVDMILGRDKAQEQERSKKRMGELE